MKLTIIAVLCLSLLLVHINLSLAAKGKLINLFKKPPKTKPNLDSKSKDTLFKKSKQPTQSNQGGSPYQPGGYPNQGSYPQQPGGYPNQRGSPQQPGGYPNQGGHPQQPGGYPNQGGHPQQPGGYPNQGGYPQQPGRYPNQGGYPQQPGYPAGGYPAQAYPYGGGYGSYPSGHINYNPNNKILSPQYGGSYGYGGYGAGGGSPFSHSVKEMGFVPSDKSRGFGRTAVMAAAGGAVAGMALGYGLGRFPRPHFHFHNPQEEYYYNYYMYKKYGIKSTDADDYSRDYRYDPPPQTYDKYMDTCMKRNDLLPAERQKPNNKPAATTTQATPAASINSTTTSGPVTVNGSNTTNNNTAADNSSTTAPSTLHPLNKSEVNPTPPPAQGLRSAATDDDDDETVSIVEIGYPALIKQMKARRCLELYMVYAERHLKKKSTTTPTPRSPTAGVQGLEMGLQGLLSVVTSTILMLLNSNMLMLLH
ncbi:uncharacterized protein LOC103357137 isoform X2 [Stegastes partitus]|uniref:Uncharacterized protein LOC103357137 isoform X2 n=1 Tax=Stegastes partitus TaxID=144197 RepID=A0A9Y4JYN3_9TELE|nr:PREDICTED: uncharacterized protein LOC103357137 isoform X2 [Stegastes partitus]